MEAGGVLLGLFPGGKALLKGEKIIDAGVDVVKAAEKLGGSTVLKQAGEIVAPGRVQSRINLQTGSVAEGSGWNHVVNEHFSSKAGKSQFTIDQTELRTILQSKEVVQSPVNRILDSADGPRYVREINLERQIIGIDKFSKQPTSTFTILTDRYGNLVTTTPGKIK